MNSGNVTSQLLDHLSQFLILKDLYPKTLINSNNVFEGNYMIFNDEFRKDLKDIPWDNILSDDILASVVFDLFFPRLDTLIDEHAPNHKLSKKEISLKAKPLINKPHPVFYEDVTGYLNAI